MPYGRILRYLIPALILAALAIFVFDALPGANLSGNQKASIVALGAFLSAILLRRGDWGGAGRVIKAAALWIGLAAILVIGYAYRGELSAVKDRVFGEIDPAAARATGERELTVRAARDGHYYVDATLNGVAMRLLIDTGATYLSLGRDDARRAGIDVEKLSYDRIVQTANGAVAAASVVIRRLAIGEAKFDDVPALVSNGHDTGALLGLSALQRFRSYEVKDGALILRW